MDLDLFGEPVKYEQSNALLYLKERDEFTLGNRLQRLEYLHQLNPEGITMAGNDMEMMFSYRELQDAFINGHFLSTIILGQSWIEKNLHIELLNRGLSNIAKKGFSEMVKYCKSENIIHSYLADKMEKFRQIRNPITHLKTLDFEYNLSNRSYANMKNPLKQLEIDSKEIIALCGHIAVQGLRN
jgi:carboxypeptidase C (cathepsin A)